MNRVFMLPQLESAQNVDASNTIHQIVVRLAKYLPAYGFEVVSTPLVEDLVASHAGMGQEGQLQPDVAICHGLYPTGERTWPVMAWHWGANKNVIADLRSAKKITVPSKWVAEILQRDMHVQPAVIPWAVDVSEWEPDQNYGYVLWAKTRADGVCDPQPLIDLASKAPNQRFVTTFGNGGANIQTMGRQAFTEMRNYIRRAGIYLSITKETFGITTLEAMACGVPVLGYKWGGTADIVEHGVTGYLVEPGDINGLREGLDYCVKYRATLGANARTVAKTFSWDKTALLLAAVFTDVRSIAAPRPRVSVVIPCHNYAKYVGQAIESVKEQRAPFDIELVVVLDRCSDDSEQVVTSHIAGREHSKWIKTDFGNPAESRNAGISLAQGEYIVCLDADDALGDPRFVQVLAAALDAEHSLGIAFTGIRIMDADGNLGNRSNWPSGYDFDAQCERRNQVPTCCMFRRGSWLQAGGYRRRYVPAEDADLWLRIGSLGYSGKQVTTEPWFVYRLHSASLSSEVRTGQRPEPDWVGDKPWTKDGKRPFASHGKPPQFSWPVHNYDQPKVTFIVPCAEHHRNVLPEALDGIECQTERHWECIVVNDSEKPLELPGFPWVRVLNTGGRKNAAYARNLGCQNARASLIAFLDADDMISPRFLELTLRAYVRTGRYVYTDWLSLNKEGVLEGHETPDYDPNIVFRQTSIHSINILIPKRDILSVGGFDETMTTWEDVDFFMKLAKEGKCGIRVPEQLVMYRYSTGSLREYGETIKDRLISTLRERYREYIEGGKMCGCASPKQAQPGNGVATEVSSDNGELVRVEYGGPSGQHQVIGLITKQDYGRRANGDVFYVYTIDQQAQTDKFLLLAEISQQEPTQIPGEPVPLEAEYA